MIDIVLATRNQNKIREIKNVFKDLKIKFLSLKEFPDSPYVEEDGMTLEENAIKKASQIAKFTGKIALSDDSGLEVEALSGKPGVYSSRFAGEDATYEDNNKKLLALMEGIPHKKRKAQFKCVIAIAKPTGETQTVEGAIKGIIANECRGKNGFGYDPVFLIPEHGKTFAEITLEEKNKISHRAKALQKAKKMLECIVF